MGKAVEIIWNLTPFRSDKFIETWTPYAELAINFGASGYLLIRRADDNLIVKQYAFFDNKADWKAYWNSPQLQKGRAAIAGYHAVPLLYTWQEVVTTGHVTSAADDSAAVVVDDAA